MAIDSSSQKFIGGGSQQGSVDNVDKLFDGIRWVGELGGETFD